MTEFSFLPDAECDLDEIVERIRNESGRERAAHVHAKLLRAVRSLAAYRRMGHVRTDLTAREVRVWTVYRYLIVYRPGTDPLEVVGILHGSRDPPDLRDRIGEASGNYVVRHHRRERRVPDSPADRALHVRGDRLVLELFDEVPSPRTPVTITADDVSAWTVEQLGVGLTQWTGLHVSDVRDAQHDRVRYVLEDQEDQRLFLRCAKLSIERTPMG